MSLSKISPQQSIMSVALASSNGAKLTEFKYFLRDLPIEVVSLQEVLGETATLPEGGGDFASLSLAKAEILARTAKIVAMADESGLEVDALGGRPGVRSRHFAHPNATDAENNSKLLKAMQTIGPDNRQACYRCTIALVDPWGNEGTESRIVSGRCRGRIAQAASGSGGFGYDPLFFVDAFQRTMGELSVDEKNQVSHRSHAMTALIPLLENILASRSA